MAGAPETPDEVRNFFAAWTESANEGNWQVFGDLMHPDIVLDDPMSPEPARGVRAALARAAQQYAPFPDGRTDIVGDPFTAVDRPELAYRWRFTGTHLRPIDPPGFAPTGERVRIEGASVLRFRDGKVVAATLFFDTTEVARQVLAAPPRGSRLERAAAVAQRGRVRLRQLSRG